VSSLNTVTKHLKRQVALECVIAVCVNILREEGNLIKEVLSRAESNVVDAVINYAQKYVYDNATQPHRSHLPDVPVPVRGARAEELDPGTAHFFQKKIIDYLDRFKNWSDHPEYFDQIQEENPQFIKNFATKMLMYISAINDEADYNDLMRSLPADQREVLQAIYMTVYGATPDQQTSADRDTERPLPSFDLEDDPDTQPDVSIERQKHAPQTQRSLPYGHAKNR
jgi:hypothetical protein